MKYGNILDYLTGDDITRYVNLCLSNMVHLGNISDNYDDNIKRANNIFNENVAKFDTSPIEGRYSLIDRDQFIDKFSGVDDEHKIRNAFQTFHHYCLYGWPVNTKKKAAKDEDE